MGEGQHTVRKTLIRVLTIGAMVSGLGCATAGAPVIQTDTEMKLAQQRAEDATLARLASSNNQDIADAAGSVARERATR
jgi:hypothetical protein